jgi:hypothetical protein
MRWRFHMATLLLALALAGPGCFVIDELDAGMATMKAHSPKKKGDAAKAATPETPETSTRDEAAKRAAALRADAQEWWKNARTPASKQGSSDPDQAAVRCRIGEGIRFMSRTDCLTQGGSL